MKVFISSLISGMEAERAVVRRALSTLRHQAVMAEDFPAQPNSPQIACLTGLRQADLVILILGARYGAKQASGLSATHEEVREALGSKSLMVFMKAGEELETEQQALVNELGTWEAGLFRAHFETLEELSDKVVQAVHDYDLANAVGPFNPDALLARALALCGGETNQRMSGNALEVVVAVGPEQSILRPAQMEVSTLGEEIKQRAMFANPRILSSEHGARATMQGETLVLLQERHGHVDAKIALWPTGDIQIRLPIPPAPGSMGSMVLLEEEVKSQLTASLTFANWLLSHVDPTERLTHLVVAVRITGNDGATWRTTAEHQQSPQSMSMAMRWGEAPAPVTLRPAHHQRAVLRVQLHSLVEDLLVLLRRQWSS
ncbi:DUF4062 domain-containing protein [Stenotrophomonas indicatrix]|jgi:hypothetical protein